MNDFLDGTSVYINVSNVLSASYEPPLGGFTSKWGSSVDFRFFLSTSTSSNAR
mgnify:CR=1 FL=1